MAEESSVEPVILHILVIGFHHTRGSEVEFCHPSLKYGEVDDRPVMPPEWQNITALALPDGAHLTTEDAVYFLLPDPDDATKQLSAVACFRQIEAADLEETGKDVKRRVVQKSVCVLCRKPLFGLIQHHLQLATHAYFREKNFTKTQILMEVYDHLNHTLQPSPTSPRTLSPDACISARKFVLRFGRKALLLFKLMLLERKVLFYSHPVQRLCETVVTLLSLFPGVLDKTVGTVLTRDSPVVSSAETTADSADLSSTSDEYGFPIRFCREDCPVLPYMSLQQMDNFKSKELHGCVAGGTNALFLHTPNLVDVHVDTDSGAVEVVEPSIRNALTLTIADQRFADQILSAVAADEQSGTSGTNWLGGDDWVRQQFRHYLVSLLICSSSKDTRLQADFGTHFCRAWKETVNFNLWVKTAHPAVTDIEPKHPCKGHLGFADLRDHNVTSEQLRQSMSQTKIRLGEAFTPFQAKIGAAGQELGGAISVASSAVGGFFSSLRTRSGSLSGASNSQETPSPPTVHSKGSSERVGRQKATFNQYVSSEEEDEDREEAAPGKSRFYSLPPDTAARRNDSQRSKS